MASRRSRIGTYAGAVDLDSLPEFGEEAGAPGLTTTNTEPLRLDEDELNKQMGSYVQKKRKRNSSLAGSGGVPAPKRAKAGEGKAGRGANTAASPEDSIILLDDDDDGPVDMTYGSGTVSLSKSTKSQLDKVRPDTSDADYQKTQETLRALQVAQATLARSSSAVVPPRNPGAPMFLDIDSPEASRQKPTELLITVVAPERNGRPQQSFKFKIRRDSALLDVVNVLTPLDGLAPKADEEAILKWDGLKIDLHKSADGNDLDDNVTLTMEFRSTALAKSTSALRKSGSNVRASSSALVDLDAEEPKEPVKQTPLDRRRSSGSLFDEDDHNLEEKIKEELERDLENAVEKKEQKEANLILLKIKAKNSPEPYEFQLIRDEDTFRKLTDKVAAKLGVDPSKVKLMFDGEKLNLDETPEDREMEDEDMLDAVVG